MHRLPNLLIAAGTDALPSRRRRRRIADCGSCRRGRPSRPPAMPTTIARIAATPVTVPLEAPCATATARTGAGSCEPSSRWKPTTATSAWARWAAAARTPRARSPGSKPYLRGHDVVPARGDAPRDLQSDRQPVQQPHAAARRARVRLPRHHRQKLGVPVQRSSVASCATVVEFAQLPLLPLPRPGTGEGEVRTAEQLVAHARELKAQHGFRSHKLKGGVFPPATSSRATARSPPAFPGERMRHDPNSAWSLGDAIRFATRHRGLANDWLEDPVYGIAQMKAAARVRAGARSPPTPSWSTSSSSRPTPRTRGRRDPARHDVLGRHPPCVKAAGVCETLGMQVAVHSSGELGIQLATMLHLGAVLPNLSYTADAHYHHLVDDVIEGGPCATTVARSACRTPRARRRAGPREARPLPRALPRARRLSLRPRPRPPRVVRARSQPRLGRSGRCEHPGPRPVPLTRRARR